MQSNYLQLKQHYIPPNSVNKPPFFSLGETVLSNLTSTLTSLQKCRPKNAASPFGPLRHNLSIVQLLPWMLRHDSKSYNSTSGGNHRCGAWKENVQKEGAGWGSRYSQRVTSRYFMPFSEKSPLFVSWGGGEVLKTCGKCWNLCLAISMF